MNLLVFLVLPIATILLAIVLQKIIRSPFLVAITFFAIYLIILVILSITGIIVDLAIGLIAVIAYTIIAFFTAIIFNFIKCICRNFLGECCSFCPENNSDDDIIDEDDNECCYGSRENNRLVRNSELNRNLIMSNRLGTIRNKRYRRF